MTGKVIPIKRPPLTITGYEQGVDLREVGWKEEHVAEVVRKYQLKHGECVVFFNNSKWWFGGGGGSHPPKCRIYWVWHGQSLTVIPSISTSNYRQVEMQHLLNKWIQRNFSIHHSLQNDLAKIFDDYDTLKALREEAEAAAEVRKQQNGG